MLILPHAVRNPTDTGTQSRGALEQKGKTVFGFARSTFERVPTYFFDRILTAGKFLAVCFCKNKQK